MSLSVAKRYAQAFFSHCSDQKNTETAYKDLKNINYVIEHCNEFNQFILNPVIDSQKRIDILEKTLKSKISDDTFRFLKFLEHKKRLLCLKDICLIYEEIYHESKNILIVNIQTSYECDAVQKKTLIQHIKLKYQKDIEASFEVVEALLGGVKLRINDIIFDNSIRNQLQQFKRKILHN